MDRRLTETRTENGVRQFRRVGDEGWLTFGAPEVGASPMMSAIQRLASYEDAEEQGRLVTLPVKIGQKVYIVMNLSVGIEPWVEETTVCAVTFKDSHYPRCVWSFSTETTEPFHKSDIGKRVFLTRAEAEAALQARNGGGA